MRFRAVGIIAALPTIFIASATIPATSGEDAHVWQSIGPTEIDDSRYGFESGRVSDLVIIGDGTIWIATASGGIWHRGPHDGAWVPSNNNLTTLAFGSIDYHNGVLYAASGEDHQCGIAMDCGKGRGVFKSLDGGRTWSLLPKSPVGRSSVVRIGSDDAKTVWVGGDFGLWRSTDGGANWREEKHAGAGGEGSVPFRDARALVALPGYHSVIAGDFTGLYRTKDFGATWERLSVSVVDDLQQSSDQAGVVPALAVAPTNPPEIVASFARGGTVQSLGCLAGLALSKDGGDTWNTILSSPNDPDYFSTTMFYSGDTAGSCQGRYDNAVAIDPKHPDRFSAAGITIFTFTLRDLANPINLSNEIGFHPDIHALAYDGDGNLYAAGDGGVIEFLPPTAATSDQNTIAPALTSARTVNQGLDITQFYGPGSVTLDGSLVVAGTQDNGTAITENRISAVKTMPTPGCQPPGPNRTSNNLFPLGWSSILDGDGGTTVVDPKNPQNIYASDLYNGQLAGRIESTADGGCHWALIGPPAQNPGGVIPFVVVGNWNDIIAGGNDLYETKNGGIGDNSWQSLNVWPTPGPQDDSNAYVTALSSSPDGLITVAGRTDGYLAILRAGIKPRTERVYGRVDGIALDPKNPTHAIVSVQGPGEDNPYCNVEETHNFSNDAPTWTSITTGLNGDCLDTTLAWFGTYTYIATSRTVYVRDKELHWEPLGAGLPIVPVVGLMFVPPSGIVAITHGRGAWYLPSATPNF